VLYLFFKQLIQMDYKEIEMRMDNLEKKVDEVIKVVSILPRIEERMIGHKDDLSDHEVRLRRLEEKQAKDNVFIGWLERGMYVLITALVGSFLYFL